MANRFFQAFFLVQIKTNFGDGLSPFYIQRSYVGHIKTFPSKESDFGQFRFDGDECIMTSDDGTNEQWTCSNPIIQANLLNPNGAISEQVKITINNTCVGF